MKLAIRRAMAGERRRWIALVVVCFAMLMNALDQTIVNVALPTIQHDLHFSQASLSWVIDAYLITFGGTLLLAGRLGDLIGRKRVFMAGVALFTVSSAVCGASSSQGMLIGARFVQGLGAALSSSVILAIIVTEFPIAIERAKAMSAYVFVAVGGGAVGLLVGGVLTQALSWHWIFFINIPIGVVTLLAGYWLIDENNGLGFGRGVDIAGAVLSTLGMLGLVYAIVTSVDYGWGSAHTLGFAAGSIAVLAAFVWWERRAADPLMPLRIFRSPGLVGSSIVRTLVVVGLYSIFFIGALYLQHILGYTTLQTGLAFLPQTLVVLVLSLGLTARIMGRFGAKRTAVMGIFLVMVALVLFSLAGQHTHYFPLLMVAFLLIGLGAAMLFTPLITIALAGVEPKDAGLGSGVVNVFQQVAAAIGVAVLGTISEDQTRSQLAAGHTTKDALWSGYNLAFVVAASSVAVALLLSTVLLRRDRSDSSVGAVVEHSGIAGDVVDELPLSVPAAADQ
ncbi:MAG TPA: MFS transporter [Acidimicrobiales bacterium]|nr:MFS transporter [Acidimicrobiales bacterium]